MSNENMSKRIPEWIIAFGVVVAMGGIWVSVMTTTGPFVHKSNFWIGPFVHKSKY